MPKPADPTPPRGDASDPRDISPAAGEPEPAWAAEIRARRRARGDRLREIFSTFDEAPERSRPAKDRAAPPEEPRS